MLWAKQPVSPVLDHHIPALSAFRMAPGHTERCSGTKGPGWAAVRTPAHGQCSAHPSHDFEWHGVGGWPFLLPEKQTRVPAPHPTSSPPSLPWCAGRSTETKGGCPRPLQAKRPLSVQESWPPVVNLALVIHSVLCQQFKRALLVFFADFN